jgi:hypothetical protein
MIDPKKVALFIPHGLKKFKLDLFETIGRKIGRVVRAKETFDARLLDDLPSDIIPIVGCTPALRPLLDKWRRSGRDFIFWDRGYLRRVFATHLPRGSDLGVRGGYYRWHLNCFQMPQIYDVPDDRWRFLKLDDRCEKGNQLKPWNRNGGHIVVADTGPDYWNLFSDVDWCTRTIDELKKHTNREIILRDKESKLPLYNELKDAHCLVSHGSIAAVESVIMGCPVFVSEMSAARFMGQTDFSKIESPVYPERQAWLNSLAYCQFNEQELVDGTLWRLLNAVGPVHASV